MPPKRVIGFHRTIPTDEESLINKGKYYDKIYHELYLEDRSEFLTHMLTNEELLKRNLINQEFHQEEQQVFLKKSKEEEIDVLTDSMSAVVFLTTIWGFIICPIFDKSAFVLFVYFIYIFFIYIMTFFLYRKKYLK